MRIQLNSPLKTFDRLVMVMLASKGIPDNAPSLRGKPIEIRHFMCKESEINFFAKVEQHCREKIHIFQSAWV
jgi:hypothetical protein